MSRIEFVYDIIKSGHEIDVDYIKRFFKENQMDNLIYKIPMYMTSLRKKGAVIDVTKNGTKIDTYRLVNYKDFVMN
jgi:hypothetical protein